MPAEPGTGAPPSWPYPLIERGSKLGIHSIRPDGVRRFTEMLVAGGGHFPVVKAVDDLSWLSEVKEISPETITVGRIVSPFEACLQVWDSTADLDRTAEALLKVILKKLTAEPTLRETVDYWEVVNEPDPPGTEEYRRLSELMVKCMERAEREELKLAIYTLNAGTPEWEEMVAVVETGVFGRARKHGHILALHEGVLTPDDPIDKWWGHLIPGSPEVEGAGSLCFRYRYLYHLLRERGEVVPLVISEWCGYDQRPLSQQKVLGRVQWYDEKARQDHWVWAFCPFTLGPIGGWESHDYEFAYPTLIEYMITLKDQQNALPPPEPPPDLLDELHLGVPREQYERLYVLLPPGSESAWALAVVEATWDAHRYTVGGSADDAGIGQLNARSVIAINPSLWPDDLEQFFQTHYPGVRYVEIEAASPEQLEAQLKSLEV